MEILSNNKKFDLPCTGGSSGEVVSLPGITNYEILYDNFSYTTKNVCKKINNIVLTCIYYNAWIVSNPNGSEYMNTGIYIIVSIFTVIRAYSLYKNIWSKNSGKNMSMIVPGNKKNSFSFIILVAEMSISLYQLFKLESSNEVFQRR